MRFLLAGIVFVLIPSLAQAQCACSCVRGRSVPACPPTSLVQPICQQICTESVGQSIATPSLSGNGSAGGSASGGGGTDAAAAAAAAR